MLRREQREALSAYYGFARAADDIADAPAVPPEEKRARLAAWRAGVEGLFSGEVPDTPLARDLARAIAAFPLERNHFLELLEGLESDIAQEQPETIADLERYMYRVASVPGLAALAIFRYTGPRARLLAENLGYAVQLTNVLRDTGEDLAAGRVYIPAEDLSRFCRRGDLSGSNSTPDFIELMKFEAARARGYYSKALKLADPGQKRQLLPALALAGLYEALLDKMEASGFRLRGSNLRLTGIEKALALIKAAGRCATLR